MSNGKRKHFLISLIINHLMYTFSLRTFLAHIRVRRSHAETSQACMSAEVSVHEYVWHPYHIMDYFKRVCWNHSSLNLLIKEAKCKHLNDRKMWRNMIDANNREASASWTTRATVGSGFSVFNHSPEVISLHKCMECHNKAFMNE